MLLRPTSSPSFTSTFGVGSSPKDEVLGVGWSGDANDERSCTTNRRFRPKGDVRCANSTLAAGRCRSLLVNPSEGRCALDAEGAHRAPGREVHEVEGIAVGRSAPGLRPHRRVGWR